MTSSAHSLNPGVSPSQSFDPGSSGLESVLGSFMTRIPIVHL
jgi:hypothetical protein